MPTIPLPVVGRGTMAAGCDNGMLVLQLPYIAFAAGELVEAERCGARGEGSEVCVWPTLVGYRCWEGAWEGGVVGFEAQEACRTGARAFFVYCSF